jgi:ParB family chromosome partitioning protein
MSLGKGLESLIPSGIPEEEINSRKVEEPVAEEVVIETEMVGVRAPEIQVKEKNVSFSETKETEVEAKTPNELIFYIETDKIYPNPHQPRRAFEEDPLRELAQSIREFGILQPLVVSKIEKESERGWDVNYELIAGERRLMAAKMLGLQTVPAIIRKLGVDREKLELSVVENIQRSDLNPIEFARAVARLQDEFKLTQREIAARLGKSREVIANSVRLLGLPTEIQEAIANGKLSESQARALLTIQNIEIREKIFQDILKYNLSVREVNARIKKLERSKSDGDKKVARSGILFDPEIEEIREKLETYLGTKVYVKDKDSGGGKITISYYSSEELEALLNKLLRQSDNQSL